jgi:hypothetical protein
MWFQTDEKFQVNQLNMNYAIVAVGGLIILVGLTWVTWGRTRFVGPVKTVIFDPDVHVAPEAKFD